MTKQTPPPATIAAPPGQRVPGADTYAAIAAADTTALPAAAVDLARRSHQWATRRPDTSGSLREATRVWGEALPAAIATGDDLPDLAPVLNADRAEALRSAIRTEYDRQWLHNLGGLGRLLAAHGDTIVTTLRPGWTNAANAMIEAVAAIPPRVRDAHDLLGIANGSALYQRARTARDACQRYTDARQALAALKGYATPTVCHWGHPLLRHPNGLQRLDRKVEELAAWRQYAKALADGEAWLPDMSTLTAWGEAERRRQAERERTGVAVFA